MTLTTKIVVAFAGTVMFAGAQVSPGPLSRAHHSLDSPLKCAQCHTFGAGKEKLKCLNCHREIFALVKAHESMHGRVFNRAKGDTDCARCHTEHYGENFRIFKWDTSKEEFDHKQTGYILEGKHAQVKCEECHNPKNISAADRKVIQIHDLTRTFEGLHPACLTCHEDHHAGQLSTECQSCHNYSKWKDVREFDHSTTKYPLTGKHRDVECVKCHKPTQADAKTIQYKGLEFATCTPCHQDPHHGAFEARCESCHNTATWMHVEISGNNFDHSKTKFPLNGKHADVACEKCHKENNFKEAVAYEKCMDCHVDQHRGQFLTRADHGECGSCHNEKGWKPTSYDETSHQSSAYPLTGKHKGLECAKCHIPAGVDTNYHPAYQVCLDCHKDPHAGQFTGERWADRCEDCHKVEGFHPSTFTLKQHQESTFALKGAHTAVGCQDCHRKEEAPEGADRRYHFANLACEGCHQDPHSGEFPEVVKAGLHAGESACESCHTLRTWREFKPFDHGTTTFALLGSHRVLACLDCHRPEGEVRLTADSLLTAGVRLTTNALLTAGLRLPGEVRPTADVPLATDLRFRPIHFKGAPERCIGCHEDVHAGQFQKGPEPVDCALCHDSVHWEAGLFNHETASTFSLAGAHEKVPCKLCHTERKEVNGRNIVTYRGTPRECVSCHR